MVFCSRRICEAHEKVLRKYSTKCFWLLLPVHHSYLQNPLKLQFIGHLSCSALLLKQKKSGNGGQHFEIYCVYTNRFSQLICSD